MNKRLANWILEDALHAYWWGRTEEANQILIRLIRRVIPETDHG